MKLSERQLFNGHSIRAEEDKCRFFGVSGCAIPQYFGEGNMPHVLYPHPASRTNRGLAPSLLLGTFWQKRGMAQEPQNVMGGHAVVHEIGGSLVSTAIW